MAELCFQINDWTLVVEENKLYRQDREISVEPRLINLLRFLAEHPGDVFCREELIDHLWDGAIVTDQVVTQSVFELRKILRDGRVDNPRYLVTVPKRGYKLVAETRQIGADEVIRPNRPTGESVHAPTLDGLAVPDSEPVLENEPAPVCFPAAPLTRAVNCISQQVMDEKIKRGDGFTLFHRWKMLFFDLFLVVVLVAFVGTLTYQQSSVHITKAIDTDLIEFTYHSSRNAVENSEYLADGISQKLMTDLSSASKYRVQLEKADFSTGILPGKEVSVRVDEVQDKTYLDVEYRSKTSNRVIFSHQYLMTRANLKQVLRQSSLDLMAALRVPVSPAHEMAILAGLPDNQEALALLVKANHFINQPDPRDFQQGIALLEKVSELEPDNGYVLAELYIAYNALAALNPEITADLAHLENTRRELVARYPVDSPSVQQPARVYEALAMAAITQDDKVRASHFLQLAHQQRESAFSYILSGKLAELEGDLDQAGDAYSRAFFIDTSVETYTLSQNLAFYSDLETVAYFMFRAVNPSEIRLI